MFLLSVSFLYMLAPNPSPHPPPYTDKDLQYTFIMTKARTKGESYQSEMLNENKTPCVQGLQRGDGILVKFIT